MPVIFVEEIILAYATQITICWHQFAKTTVHAFLRQQMRPKLTAIALCQQDITVLSVLTSAVPRHAIPEETVLPQITVSVLPTGREAQQDVTVRSVTMDFQFAMEATAFHLESAVVMAQTTLPLAHPFRHLQLHPLKHHHLP